ncbi:MAG TPA: guanosine-3',5'-bis(diphosphate) 3'-diphosphatase, partial [Methylococcales bacterium]
MSNIAGTVKPKRLQDELIERLCATLSGYLNEAQISDCVRAYEFSADAHSGQFRKSGESYICHPLSVAITLAEMRMDASG